MPSSTPVTRPGAPCARPARHRLLLAALVALLAASGISGGVASAAPAAQARAAKATVKAAKRKPPPRVRIGWLRCQPLRTCPRVVRGPRKLVRTWKVEVAGTGIRPGAQLLFRVQRGRRVGTRAVRGVTTRQRHLFVRVPADAVGGGVRLRVGRQLSNVVVVHVQAVPRPKPAPRPAPSAPANPLGGASASAFDGNGMWIWYVSKSHGGSPAAIAAQARAHGIRTIFVKSSDAANFWPQFSAASVAALKATGLRVCAWQFVYGNDPLGEARAGAQAVTNGADCLVIDAEGAYEGKYAQAQRYITALRNSIGASYPLGLTSFPYVDYHPALPYSVFLGPGAASFNLPQMYWKTIGTSVDTNYARTYGVNQVYGRPIYPLGQTYENPLSADVVRFRQLAAAYGARGVSWWDWQETSDAAWSALGVPFTALPAGTVAAPAWPVLKAGAAGKVGSRGDLVVWAQQHLAGAGQSVTVDGDFGPGTQTAVRAFQTANGLPVTGIVDAATWPRLLAAPVAKPAWVKAAGARVASAGGQRNGPRSAELPARRYEIPRGPLRPPLG